MLRPKNEVVYARLSRMPEELTGCMRLLKGRVRVNVIGTQDAGEFAATEGASMQPIPGDRELSAYIVVHEADMAQLIRNTQELQDLKRKLAEQRTGGN